MDTYYAQNVNHTAVSTAQRLGYVALCALRAPVREGYDPVLDRAVEAVIHMYPYNGKTVCECYLALDALMNHAKHEPARARWVAETILGALQQAGIEWVRLFN